MKRKNIVAYLGIADIEGIDQFSPIDKVKVSFLDIRAKLNSPRKPIVFRAFLYEEDVEQIKEFLKTNAKAALIYLKKKALEIGTLEKNQQKEWDSLPYSESKKTESIEVVDKDQLGLGFEWQQ